MVKRNPKKPIVCSNCGKKVGWITIRPRLKYKILGVGLFVAIVTQIIAEFIVYRIFR